MKQPDNTKCSQRHVHGLLSPFTLWSERTAQQHTQHTLCMCAPLLADGSSASWDPKKQPTVSQTQTSLCSESLFRMATLWRLPTQESVNSSRDKQTMVHRTAVPKDDQPRDQCMISHVIIACSGTPQRKVRRATVDSPKVLPPHLTTLEATPTNPGSGDSLH